MDDIHEQGTKSRHRVMCRAMANVEQLGAQARLWFWCWARWIHAPCSQRPPANVFFLRDRPGGQVMGSSFALRHEQDFDWDGEVHALAWFDSVSMSVCTRKCYLPLWTVCANVCITYNIKKLVCAFNTKCFIFIWLTSVRCSDKSVVWFLTYA